MTYFDHDSPTDARVQRTRQDLFQAFAQLVLTQRYDDIQVGAIIERAGIARSTFYEHFSGKDAILIDSMSGMLAVLARTAINQNNETELRSILDHFWENRAFARIILNGPPYRLITRRLSELIERHLEATEDTSDHPVPRQMRATQLAETIFSPIRTWLSGEASCSSEVLARHLLNGYSS